MTDTVLIVDDSLTVRMDLQEAFEEAGFQTRVCATAAAAREALAGAAPQVVLLDVLLPDGDGVDLLKELRASDGASGAVVLMLSTEAEVKDRLRGLRTGADEYVGKPYDTHYVVARARELLRARQAEAAPGRSTILVIDDSVTFREALRQALEEAGYAVLVAGSGEEGLRAAAAARPGAIVVDSILPGLDGATVIRRLRLDAALRSVPCLLLTSSEERDAELRALEAGADAFVRKEEDVAVILARLAAALRSAATSLPDKTASLLGPKRILAVDDSATYLAELAAMLRDEGYDVVSARSGEEALELLAVQAMDCILLDLLMPGLSGRETCQRIKAAPAVRDIPLIMLTALEDRGAMLDALEAGADDYIQKSSEFEVLKARVRAQLRRKQFEDDNRRIRKELHDMALEAAEASAARALAAGLQRSRDELELRVQERTAQLQAEIAERTRAEETLRESQQLLQAISDNSAAVIYAKDLQGRYLLVNRRFAELFHIGDGAIVGRSDHTIFPKEAADAFRAMDQRAAAADEPLVEEETAPHDDGPHTYVSVKCPLRDRHGRVYGVFGISTDITERKQVEDALRASEERTRLIVDTALDAVVTMDDAGVITGWSPQAETTFGWTRAEALGLPLEQTIIPQRHREAHRRGLGRYLATGEAAVLNRRIELTALHRDGREFPVDLSITPIRSGGSISFSAFVRDIAERKSAEARLQAQLERLTLLDQITRAIGERQDLRSIYQVAIRSVEERLPVDFACVCRHDAVDNALTVIRVGAHSQALAAELALNEQSRIEIDQDGLSRCLRGELVHEPDILAMRYRFPQRLVRGGLRALVVAPLQSESRVFGVLVVARRQPQSFSSGDCEFLRQLSAHVALAAQQAELHGALQQAYDDLRQTQQTVMQQERLRALGQMASGIAHDINNALSPVALYTEALLEHEPHLSERGRGYLATIARAIDDVAATVARMREFYRQREPQLQLTSVQLNPLVQQVLDLTRARWSDMPQQRGVMIRLETDLTPDLPAVLGIESEVREALTNLVFNAVDALPEGGVLTLRTRCAGPREGSAGAAARHVVLEVTDTGVGMDENTRRRCLEPFFTTKGERGTGLGLAMVYGFAQRHGADLDIDSDVGRGTTVRLSFPIPVSGPTASAAPPPEMPMSGLRILLVDDDPLTLKSLRDALEADGHLVVAANGGQAGIDAFRAARQPVEAFAVVITDLGMPYVDGRKVAAAVKADAAATPVILLTGWGQQLMADGDTPPHIDRVLSKPPKMREVRAALAQLTL